ncbi:MAG: M56 family metallopeptidase [Planctomycetota bacterium]
MNAAIVDFSAVGFTAAANWLCTFAVHSTLLLAIGLLASFALRRRAVALQERVLRFSLWAALVSSIVQYFVLGRALPLNLELPTPTPASVDLPATVGVELHEVTSTSMFVLSALDEPAFTLASLPWPAIVVGSACMSAVIGLLWLWLVYRGLSRVLALRQPEVDPRVLATAAVVARELGLRQSPHVSRCDLIATPIAFGWMRPEICLPEKAAGLGDASLRAMLAHEIAHIRRGDPAWMWLAACLQALFPWQVLLLFVRRRWSRLVELRCDATAARHSSPTAVARCLIDVAEWLRPDARTSLVTLGMAARPSSLRERVEAALHPQPAATPRPFAFATFGGLSLSALTLVAPGVQTATAVSVPSAWSTPDAAPPDAVPPDDAASSPPMAVVDGDAMVAAMELLQSEHASLAAEAARLRSDLRRRAQPAEIEQMLSALERRLVSLERLRARLQTRLDQRPTEPR